MGRLVGGVIIRIYEAIVRGASSTIFGPCREPHHSARMPNKEVQPQFTPANDRLDVHGNPGYLQLRVTSDHNGVIHRTSDRA
jgi:hypothetical protein